MLKDFSQLAIRSNLTGVEFSLVLILGGVEQAIFVMKFLSRTVFRKLLSFFSKGVFGLGTGAFSLAEERGVMPSMD